MFTTTLALVLVLATSSRPDVIAKLVNQLGDDDYQVRQKAEEELIKIGRPALEPCRKAAKTTDPEVRARCKRVVLAFYLVYNSKGFLPGLAQMDEEIKAEISKALDIGPSSSAQERYAYFANRQLPAYDSTIYGSWDQYTRLKDDLAVRLMANDLLDAGWEQTKVRDLLDRMTKISVYGYDYYYGSGSS